MNKVTICKEYIQKSIKFGHSFASSEYQKSSKDFGSKLVQARESTDKIADTISGKLGEFAFKEFCRQNGLDIEIDLSLKKGYREIDDGQDILTVNGKVPKLKFDIKESKKYAQWLLVESHKISEEVILADVYIFVRLDLPKNIEHDLKLFDVETINAEITGFVYKEDFFDMDNEPWFNYKAGSKLLKEKIATGLFQTKELTYGNYKKEFIVTEFIEKKLIKNDDTFLNISLKAENNFGLPIGMLRNKKSDYDELFSLLLNESVYSENIVQRYKKINKGS